jgi:hypothetical protein
LPVDGKSRHYVDESAWDSVIGAFYAWPDHVNANQKNLSNLGVLTFAAGGYIATSLGIGAAPAAGVRLDLNGGHLSMGALNSGAEIRVRTGYAVGASGGVGIKAADVNGDTNYDGLGLWGHDGIAFFTGQAERLRITSGGNVGIGTASPDSVLHLTRSHGLDTTVTMFKASFDGNWGFRLDSIYDADGIAYALRQRASSTNYDSLYFKAGKVGIGAPPPARFSVVGPTSNASSLATAISAAAVYWQLKSTSGWVAAFGSGPSDQPYLQVAVTDGSVAGSLLLQPYGGRIIQAVPASAPIDADLLNSTVSIWYDEGSNRLAFRCKTSGGVLKTGFLNVS